jgi:hypothetical protein
VAVAALVLGILATIFPFLFLVSPNFIVLSVPMALVALILAIFARKGAIARSEPTGTATAAMVLGVVPLIVSVAMLMVCARAIDAAKEYSKDPKVRERIMKERIKSNQEFDEVFNKAIEASGPSPAPKQK